MTHWSWYLTQGVLQTVEQRQRAEKLKQRRADVKEERLRKIKLRKLGVADDGDKTATEPAADDGADDAGLPESVEEFLARARREALQ